MSTPEITDQDLPELDDTPEVDAQSKSPDIDKPNPMPKALKFFLWLLLLGFVAAFLLLSGIVDIEQIKNRFLNQNTTEQVQDSSVPQHFVDAPDEIPIGTGNVSGENLPDSTGKDIEALNAKIATLEYELQTLKLSLSQVKTSNPNQADIGDLGNRVLALEGLDLEQFVTKAEFSGYKHEVNLHVRANSDILKQRIASVEQSQKKVIPKKQKKIAKKPIYLPFTLVSIDQWGDKRQAVVQIDRTSRLVNLNQGDIYKSWKVHSLGEKTVTFKHQVTGILTKRSLI